MTSMQVEIDGHLTVEQVAKKLLKSKRTIYRYIKNQKLPAMRIGTTYLISIPKLKRWLNRHQVS